MRMSVNEGGGDTNFAISGGIEDLIEKIGNAKRKGWFMGTKRKCLKASTREYLKGEDNTPFRTMYASRIPFRTMYASPN